MLSFTPERIFRFKKSPLLACLLFLSLPPYSLATATDALDLPTGSKTLFLVNDCVIGTVSKPHVEIYYSQEAAHISFEPAFLMLVKQI